MLVLAAVAEHNDPLCQPLAQQATHRLCALLTRLAGGDRAVVRRHVHARQCAAWLPELLIRKILVWPEREARREPEAWKTRKCPKCASRECLFRSRKQMAAEQDKLPAWETKYRCRACEYEWKE